MINGDFSQNRIFHPRVFCVPVEGSGVGRILVFGAYRGAEGGGGGERGLGRVGAVSFSALAVFSRNALYKSTFYLLTYLPSPEIFDYLMKWRILMRSALQRKAYEMNTRQRTKSGTYQHYSRPYNFSNFGYRTKLSRLAFLANALSTSSGVGEYSRWHCSKRSTCRPILRHGRTDRRQRSLQLGEDALRVARRYGQPSHQQAGRPAGG